MAGWELNPETGDFIWIPDLTEDNVAWGFEYFHPYELDAVKKKSNIIKKSKDVSQEASSEKKSANNDIQNKSTQNYGILFWGVNSREDGVPYDAKDYGCPRDTWGLGDTSVGSFMEMGNSIGNFFTQLMEWFSPDDKEETQTPSTSATKKKNEDNKVEYRTFDIYKAIPAGYHTDGVLKGTPYYSSGGKKEKIGVSIYMYINGKEIKIGEYREK
jgi:hypothetical protein